MWRAIYILRPKGQLLGPRWLSSLIFSILPYQGAFILIGAVKIPRTYLKLWNSVAYSLTRMRICLCRPRWSSSDGRAFARHVRLRHPNCLLHCRYMQDSAETIKFNRRTQVCLKLEGSTATTYTTFVVLFVLLGLWYNQQKEQIWSSARFSARFLLRC